ncbi:hypothetical protein BIV23_31490 [Streptomyces monashensis]|uniref:Uncharacterized protein n=1 Tax=Streptomyces monashensis TaxID=1678012 RepID=A0A1S2PT77_9ACTN|nr:hypothetical protein BIV23_31490 [Streptomyces monashensis]
MIVLLAVSACSTTPDRAVSDKQLRELGESSQAVQARERAEQRFRSVAQAYADRTPLTRQVRAPHRDTVASCVACNVGALPRAAERNSSALSVVGWQGAG